MRAVLVALLNAGGTFTPSNDGGCSALSSRAGRQLRWRYLFFVPLLVNRFLARIARRIQLSGVLMDRSDQAI
jgi:hypothetical protein